MEKKIIFFWENYNVRFIEQNFLMMDAPSFIYTTNPNNRIYTLNLKNNF